MDVDSGQKTQASELQELMEEQEMNDDQGLKMHPEQKHTPVNEDGAE